MAERLIRLLLVVLLLAPSPSSGGWRGARPDAIVVRHAASQVSAQSREAKLPALSRSGIKRQTGSGPLPGLAAPPPPAIRVTLAPGGVKPLPASTDAVLPRRLNRPLYSGTPPPLPAPG
jgi:hypothetical protein